MPIHPLRVEVRGRSVELAAPGPHVVGRDPEAAVAVDSGMVSRQHVVLRADDVGWIAEDASRNGTFVNGQRIGACRIDQPLRLHLGDPEGIALDVDPRIGAAPPPSGPPPGPTASVATVESPAVVAAPPPPASEISVLHHTTAAVVRIGREHDNTIVIDDLLASRHHAELRHIDGGHTEIVDLGSHNGTFVNGRRVNRHVLGAGDIVSIGRRYFRFRDDALEEYVDQRGVAFSAYRLTVRTAQAQVLLDDVSFALEPGAMLAVVGPSGAGKSTLMNALTGLRPATTGMVLYDGRNLYSDYDHLKHRIGFVPQDDILHPELTVRRALEYAAELRFPPDVSKQERSQRVDEVLAELELTHRHALPISRLSGGQRKRVSVGIELLTRPSLLVLDEPTSGLDPGLERGVMQLLRQLADGGRTVIVVTHSVQSLALCDRVLVMAPGGKTAYLGSPQLAPAYFGADDFQEVFQKLTEGGEVDWKGRFTTHTDYDRFVRRPFVELATTGVTPAAAVAKPHAPSGWLRQLSTLTRRYLSVLAGDRRNLVLLLAQAPIIAIAVLYTMPGHELAPPPPGELRLLSKAGPVLFYLTLVATWLGATNAVREIVKERAVFQRERAVGQSVSAYLASKVVVLGLLNIAQSIVLVLIITASQDGPGEGVWLPWGRGELMIAVALTSLSSTAAGLLVSSLSSTANVAMTVLPLVLILQNILSIGGVFPEIADKPGLKQASYFASAQWGFSAEAATADLNQLQASTNVVRQLSAADVLDPDAIGQLLSRPVEGEPRWDHELGAWLFNMAALAVICAVLLLATGFVLLRQSRAP